MLFERRCTFVCTHSAHISESPCASMLPFFLVMCVCVCVCMSMWPFVFACVAGCNDASGWGWSCRWYVADSLTVCVCVCVCVCFVLVLLVLLAEFVLVGGVCLESLHTEYVYDCVCVLQSATAAAFKLSFWCVSLLQKKNRIFTYSLK